MEWLEDFWDHRYSGEDFVYGTRPNVFLVSQRHLFKPGMKVFVVGDGEGRNGVWLARQGLEVLSVDISQEGLRKAETLARRQGAKINTVRADLQTWLWPKNLFDLVVSIFVHFIPESQIRMHQAMYHSLKPGGILIMESFAKDQLRYASGGPLAKEMLYSAELLRQDFCGANIAHLEESVTVLDEGFCHRGPCAVVRMIVMK